MRQPAVSSGDYRTGDARDTGSERGNRGDPLPCHHAILTDVDATRLGLELGDSYRADRPGPIHRVFLACPLPIRAVA
ncbi:hypothetical protein Ari01nite_55600 [Paractinoplanes rishiriensis]|uniref:Uncharacterized protein n=1 Tax=Paractinoplanes rishiriensis TaxID=1050105 RepID=A0A919K342_9ACTN|nr:hypothetical protein Ari01nite_55600 [Actinoplanes rishiriensis]